MMNTAILYNKSWVCYSVNFLFLNFSILIIAPRPQITCTDVLWLVLYGYIVWLLFVFMWLNFCVYCCVVCLLIWLMYSAICPSIWLPLCFSYMNIIINEVFTACLCLCPVYINHRPVFGLSPADIAKAFRVLGQRKEGQQQWSIPRDELLILLQQKGWL